MAACLSAACGSKDQKPEVEAKSPTARVDIVEALRADLLAERHPADGAGKVELTGGEDPVIVGNPGSWSFEFEVGREGIATGGYVFFQAPPFWGWSPPQVVAPDRLGFTTVEPADPAIEIDAATVDEGLLAVEVVGRALEPGDRLTFRYGAGPAGALADSYAERHSCFYFGVDGDGDGIRGLLAKQPCIEVEPGPAAALVLTVPTTAKAGDTVELAVAIVDARFNRGPRWQGTVLIECSAGLDCPPEVELREEDGASSRVAIGVDSAGVYRIVGRTSDGLESTSNPLVIGEFSHQLRWGDLHGHSNLTDGTGTPGDYFRYARDVAALDIVALTDHDHWGMEPLAVHPELWEEVRRETELFHLPGRFVTLLGYEWTSWLHGHRHVLYFSDQGEIYSSVSREYEDPSQLWAALRGRDALTFAHHSAGGPIATNWSFTPDPILEPVTEIVSVHGASEAVDSPSPIYSAVRGNFVRDVLDRGFMLGFIGSGDSHDGHPGLAHRNAASGGLAAMWVDDLSRASVLAALQQRRTYATNGPRLFLEARLDDLPMGSSVDVGGDRQLAVRAVGVAPIERVDIVRGGLGVESVSCNRRLECKVERRLPSQSREGYVYVRVVQVDGGAAWSSPFFFTSRPATLGDD